MEDVNGDREHLKMAEGLTDHIWSLEEMFTFGVPVQWMTYTTKFLGLSKSNLIAIAIPFL
ncbi:MAG: hypothetical protein MASP_00915 [Candidatus Methanolliviera sp. GoM_asphalt]|nr:MAG: hypothetical protein MASP_00915 [Candidatus Methanolliviera sp. GoM_asphalt]